MDPNNSKSQSSNGTKNANSQQSGERRITLNLSRLGSRPNNESAQATVESQQNQDALESSADVSLAQANHDKGKSAKQSGKPNGKAKGDSGKGNKLPPWMLNALQKKSEQTKEDAASDKDAANSTAQSDDLSAKAKKSSESDKRRKAALDKKEERRQEHLKAFDNYSATNFFELNFREFQDQFDKLDFSLDEYINEQLKLSDFEIQNDILDAIHNLDLKDDDLAYFNTKKNKYKRKETLTSETVNEEISKYLRFRYRGLFKVISLYHIFCENFKLELFNQLDKQCREYCRNVSSVSMADIQQLVDTVEPLDVAANKLLRLCTAESKCIFGSLFNFDTFWLESKDHFSGENSKADLARYYADQRLDHLSSKELDNLFTFADSKCDESSHEDESVASNASTEDEDLVSESSDSASDASAAALQDEHEQSADSSVEESATQSTRDKAVLSEHELEQAKHLSELVQRSRETVPNDDNNLSLTNFKKGVIARHFMMMCPEKTLHSFIMDLDALYSNQNWLGSYFANETLKKLNDSLASFDGYDPTTSTDLVVPDDATLSSGYEWLNTMGSIAAGHRQSLDLLFLLRLKEYCNKHKDIKRIDADECIYKDDTKIFNCEAANFKENLSQLSKMYRQINALRKRKYLDLYPDELTSGDLVLDTRYIANISDNSFAAMVSFVSKLNSGEFKAFKAIVEFVINLSKQSGSSDPVKEIVFDQEKLGLLKRETGCSYESFNSLLFKMDNSILFERKYVRPTRKTNSGIKHVYAFALTKKIFTYFDKLNKLLDIWSMVEGLQKRMNQELLYMNPGLRLVFECSENLSQKFKNYGTGSNNFLDFMQSALSDEVEFNKFRNKYLEEIENDGKADDFDGDLSRSAVLSAYYALDAVERKRFDIDTVLFYFDEYENFLDDHPEIGSEPFNFDDDDPDCSFLNFDVKD